MLIIPAHQFEIRFTNLLNFPNCVFDTIPEFINISSNLRIENERSHNANIILFFKESFDTITIRWDRIIYKSESDKDLNNSQAVLNQVFFKMFSKISNIHGFGSIKNVLHYSMFINTHEGMGFEEAREVFTSKYFNSGIGNFFPSIEDIGFVIEYDNANYRLTTNYGPYSGPSEIEKHGKGNFFIEDPHTMLKLNGVGEIALISVLNNRNLSTVTFSDYKDMLKEAKSITEKIWR